MSWQDIVFTIGSVVLTIGILPMLWHKHKPPLSASIPVALVLYVFSATYLTLGFVAAPIIETVQATLWLWLAVQRLREDWFVTSYYMHSTRPWNLRFMVRRNSTDWNTNAHR